MKTLHQFDEVFDTQTVFRLVLEAMANPTRTVSVAAQKEKLFGTHGALLALGMTLLDNEVTFSTCGGMSLQEELLLVTQSQTTDLSDADYIFVPDMRMLSAVFVQAKCGSLIDPHRSATLLIRDGGEKKHTIQLYGPGIADAVEYYCSETMWQAIELRDQQEYEYPMGVDMIFITDSGDVTCIPRLVRRSVPAWHM